MQATITPAPIPAAAVPNWRVEFLETDQMKVVSVDVVADQYDEAISKAAQAISQNHALKGTHYFKHAKTL